MTRIRKKIPRIYQAYSIHHVDEPDNPVYIGATSLGAAHRFSGHLRNASQPDSRVGKRPISQWVREVGLESASFSILGTFDNMDDAWDFEEKEIARLKSLGFALKNQSSGGKINRGMKMSEEQKKFLSSIKTGKPSPLKGLSQNLGPDQVEARRVAFLERISKNGHPRAKLSGNDVLEIRRRYDAGEGPKSIVVDFPQITGKNISEIGRRKSWKSIPEG